MWSEDRGPSSGPQAAPAGRRSPSCSRRA
jgi:hypothetical protein